MPTSLEKLDQLHQEFVTTAPAGDASPAELALRTLLVTAGPMIVQTLPQNPGDLDDLLERGAVALLAMRSDDAPEQLQVTRAGAELEAPAE